MKLTEETKRLGIASGGGALVGVVLTVLAFKVFGGPSAAVAAPGRPGAALSERSRGPAAAAGATLTVDTPAPRYPGVLRAGPSAKSKNLASVPRGSVVQVVDAATDEAGHRWYKVAFGKKVGFMHGDILS